MEDYASFILFYLVIVTLCYSFQAFPLLTIVWSHYKKTEGKVTGMIFAVFGISTFGFIILITYIVNPTNDKAALEVRLFKSRFRLVTKRSNISILMSLKTRARQPESPASSAAFAALSARS